ncbi:MAG: transglutaminase-like domain-containing protein [Lachnospiraceae bacterium]
MDQMVTPVLIERILAYYQSGMPYCDKVDVPEKVLYAFAEHAAWLREHVAWCSELPEEIFLENVAAYRVNSERIEDCYKLFYDMVMPVLDGLSLEEAILRVNLWCAQNATYHQADARTANAVTVYKSGFGRCGEESTFAVTVLRSVGIAARQVYAPLWAHCNDNHAWVEVYCGGRWQYFGACEPEPVLNQGWFSLPASRAILVHARSFGLQEHGDDIISHNGAVTYHNVTAHYAKTVTAVLTLCANDGSLFADMQVHFKVLNYAHYGLIATLHTNQNGEVQVQFGLGSVQVSAVKDNVYYTGIIQMMKSGKHRVVLEPVTFNTWQKGEFIAPEGDKSIEENPHVPDAFKQELEQAKKMREERIASYYDAVRGAQFPQAEKLLKMAGGNFEEVISFLEKDKNPCRMKMLKALSDKDYYDLNAAVLEDHLTEALAFQDSIEEQIFVDYILNPRIEHEELFAWRSGIKQIMGACAPAFREEPARIWKEVCAKVKIPTEDAYPTLRMNPLTVLKGGRGSAADQKILFVAVARSCGIPARLHPVTGEPQYYQNGVFHSVMDSDKCSEQEYGNIVFLANGNKWVYLTDWSVEYMEDGTFRVLDMEESPWEEEQLVLEAEPGAYHVTTTVRLTGGSQRFMEYFFTLCPGERKEIALERSNANQDALRIKLPEVRLHLANAERNVMHTLESLRDGQRAICIWICEGEEPTEHILNELLERMSDVLNCQKRIFLLSGQRQKQDGTLAKLMHAAPDIRLAYVDDTEAAVQIAEAAGLTKKTYPLAVVLDEGGSGIYATCGYNVGSIAQMLMRISC